jgi:hypothetical protein
MKNLNDILRQEEKIISKHPYLLDVEFKKVSDTNLSIKEIADFIDVSWKDTYKGKERFIYDESYLRWAYGFNGFNNNSSLCALKDNNLIGIILFTPRNFMNNNYLINTGIQSGLSILSSEKGNGLGQILFTKAQKMAKIDDLSLIIYWFHKSLNIKYSSLKIQKKENKELVNYNDYHINARIFDYQRATSNSDLFMYEKAFIKLLSKDPRKEKEKIELIDDNNIEEAFKFANNYAKQNNGRVFSFDEFKNYANYSDNYFSSMGLVARKNNEIEKLFVGYPITTEYNHKDKVFFLDYFITNTNNDVSSFEGTIKDKYDVHTILSLYPQHGITNLFLPTRNVLSLKTIEFNKSLMPYKSFIIDHK